ncbi:UPF0280 family protein [uncultured Desulfobacter sp.]|uniref:UPF0280 family protein n=1 Tax=uncultured Desulfobacter sp. TaxID=240139 RepID=UPI002AAB63C2|nr:UPF0280 family protein [uncultured Desulfobacter sp.]
MFENRQIYRVCHQKQGLISFNVTVKETNLNIQADSDLSEQAVRSVLTHRQYVENHISRTPGFAGSLSPLAHPGIAPKIICEMTMAAKTANVGPMAAVAGAVAQSVGKDLLQWSSNVLVENGGDIFIKSETSTIFTIYAGSSPLSMKTGIKVARRPDAFGMCTSSGTVGHSKSFGKADAVTVLAQCCALADAAATSLCNQVQSPKDIEKTIAAGRCMAGVQGIVIIAGKQIGLWGGLELIKL